VQRLKRIGATVIAWRQGFFGKALVAAGSDGYDTSAGMCEKTDFKRSRQRVKSGSCDGDGGGAPSPIFSEAPGRSIPGQRMRNLLENPRARGLIICGDGRCYPHGVASMSPKTNRRQHNTRSCAKALRALEQMPNTS
jgi:hypothetical protein